MKVFCILIVVKVLNNFGVGKKKDVGVVCKL